MPDAAASDEFLLQAAGKGDFTAFTELVSRHNAWAWNVAYRFLGHKENAADVVQDAFIRLLDAAGRYQPTALFKTYFRQIIIRICLDRAKKKQPLYLRKGDIVSRPVRPTADSLRCLCLCRRRHRIPGAVAGGKSAMLSPDQ